ncbi:AbrB/MazE/SpoVT family DNA-binding domain-containing protein [Bifidobacterium ramosum]|nr:AbrB/MazE/SpoVT family DNA-binding domain-containing protein [Bifidobacterium ramosum]
MNNITTALPPPTRDILCISNQGGVMADGIVNKWGNSEGIRIPKDIRERTGLHEGSRVSIEVEGERIIITPIRPRTTHVGRYIVPDIRTLFADYHGDYAPHEDGFTAAVGREEL